MRYGIPPMKVISMATKFPALLYREFDEMGTIEPGKLADIIVVNGNPLRNMAALEQKQRDPCHQGWRAVQGSRHRDVAPGLRRGCGTPAVRGLVSLRLTGQRAIPRVAGGGYGHEGFPRARVYCWPQLWSLSTSLPKRSRRKSSNQLAIVGGMLIDGHEGVPIQNSVVLVEGDRIVPT